MTIKPQTLRLLKVWDEMGGKAVAQAVPDFFLKVWHNDSSGFLYGCADCSGCPHKSKCLYKYDEQTVEDKNKVMKINEYWEELQAESHANILSGKGF